MCFGWTISNSAKCKCGRSYLSGKNNFRNLICETKTLVPIRNTQLFPPTICVSSFFFFIYILFCYMSWLFFPLFFFISYFICLIHFLYLDLFHIFILVRLFIHFILFYFILSHLTFLLIVFISSWLFSCLSLFPRRPSHISFFRSFSPPFKQ